MDLKPVIYVNFNSPQGSNIFSIMGEASQALYMTGTEETVINEMVGKVTKASDYHAAVEIVKEYVEIVDKSTDDYDVFYGE